MKYVDFDKTGAYNRLRALAAGKKYDFTALLTAERVKACLTPMAAGLNYSWAAKGAEGPELKAFRSLAEEQELIGKYRALLDGELVNTGENRRVLHHLLRGQLGKAVIQDGKDIGAFYRQELDRVA
ncbi:MAG: glucose-6-phosphate isomerase, partial [Treponema sp.]|nr:glucose-6-phosphate isomerase [Treponema sp.]